MRCLNVRHYFSLWNRISNVNAKLGKNGLIGRNNSLNDTCINLLVQDQVSCSMKMGWCFLRAAKNVDVPDALGTDYPSRQFKVTIFLTLMFNYLLKRKKKQPISKPWTGNPQSCNAKAVWTHYRRQTQLRLSLRYRIAFLLEDQRHSSPFRKWLRRMWADYRVNDILMIAFF